MIMRNGWDFSRAPVFFSRWADPFLRSSFWRRWTSSSGFCSNLTGICQTSLHRRCSGFFCGFSCNSYCPFWKDTHICWCRDPIWLLSAGSVGSIRFSCCAWKVCALLSMEHSGVFRPCTSTRRGDRMPCTTCIVRASPLDGSSCIYWLCMCMWTYALFCFSSINFFCCDVYCFYKIY